MNASTATTMLTGLLSLCLFSPAMAADFSGSLKGVSITDAQASNKAPIATFTYTQNGDILTFDANGSSDPDGSISKYKWDFGNGTTAEGVTTTYTLTSETPFTVTLTVIDNNNGIALNQQPVTPASKGIRDDFSTDTTANYTVVTGKVLSVYDGALHTAPWSTTFAYHNTSLGNSDHSIEADVVYESGYSGGLLVRYDPQQNKGYIVYFQSGRIMLNIYNNGATSYLAHYDGKYNSNTYRLKVTINGSMITVSVNGEDVLTKNDTALTNGSHAGVILKTGVNVPPVTVDNLFIDQVGK